MLTLEVEDFKCYQSKFKKEFSLGVTLINGESGVGKSTLFTAITWCLFREPKNVTSWSSGSKSKTVVTLTFGNLKIIRKKKPETLEVHVEDQILNEAAAQEYLNALFGSLLIWQASSFVSRREINPLLTMSQNERFDILQWLAFGSQKEEIDLLFGKVTALCETKTTEYRKNSAVYENFSNEYKKKWPDYLERSVYELEEVKEALKAVKEDIREAERKIKERDLLLDRIAYLKKDIEAFRFLIRNPLGDLDSLKADLELSLKEKEAKRLDLEIKKKDLEISKFSDLNLDTFEENWNKRDLEEAQRQEKKYEMFSKVLKRNNIEEKDYTSLKAGILSLSEFLDDIKIFDSLKEVKKLDLPSIEDLKKTLISLTEELNSSKKAKELIKCPHCNNYVKYIGKCLQKADSVGGQRNEADIQDEISEINDKISLLKKQKEEDTKRQRELDKLKHSIEEIIQAKKDMLDINFSSVYPEISNLDVCSPSKFKSSEIKKYLENLELKAQMSTLILQSKIFREERSKLPEILRNKDSEKIKKEIKDLEKLLNDNEVYRNEVKKKTSELDSLLNRISQEDFISFLEDLRRKETLLLEAMSFSEDSIKNTNFLEKVNQDKSDLEKNLKLKDLMIETEVEYIENLLESINVNLQEITESIFEENILISFEMYKTAKSTGRIKNNIHLKINYKGSALDSIKDLSDGEIDRISLAVTVSLNKVTNNPLLILDETISTIEVHRRSNCIKMIKRQKTASHVLIVMHDGIEGIFDNIMTLK